MNGFQEINGAILGLKRGSPITWSESCTHTEVSLHQLSPYIGKLKSNIVTDLLNQFTSEGDLIVDPFCGSGTIPFQASLLNRDVFAADSSSYAILLTKAKLTAPLSLNEAILTSQQLFIESEELAKPDLESIPDWVRGFFHHKTLEEIVNFVRIAKKPGNEFYLACLMGILHHQRPGFLSYPSSHLVPYLRDNKYPKSLYPELYEYRELLPRLQAKITRAYKRTPKLEDRINTNFSIRKGRIENIKLPTEVDCFFTSPPYMNALDYERDNRLRIWFLESHELKSFTKDRTSKKEYYLKMMRSFFKNAEEKLSKNGKLILVLGNKVNKGSSVDLLTITLEVMSIYSPSLEPICCYQDTIPDIRRARRSYKAVREENIIVFKKVQ